MKPGDAKPWLLVAQIELLNQAWCLVAQIDSALPERQLVPESPAASSMTSTFIILLYQSIPFFEAQCHSVCGYEIELREILLKFYI